MHCRMARAASMDLLAFACGVITNHFFLLVHIHIHSAQDRGVHCSTCIGEKTAMARLFSASNAARTATPLTREDVSIRPVEQQAKFPSAVVARGASNRCALDWNAATSRCRRAPMPALDVSARANLSCLDRETDTFQDVLPPPVVAIAALPHSGGRLLRTGLEYATGVRIVASAEDGKCSPQRAAFIETA